MNVDSLTPKILMAALAEIQEALFKQVPAGHYGEYERGYKNGLEYARGKIILFLGDLKDNDDR